MIKRTIFFLLMPFLSLAKDEPSAWIRINQLGYLPGGVKVAVWCSKGNSVPKTWDLVDAATGKVVASGSVGRAFGTYGPFKETFRLDFSAFNNPGSYFLRVLDVKSPIFKISNDVYRFASDFCLRYMRQQRTGFNPFLKDSCHTRDGYVLYGSKAGIPDSTHIDVVGGWHDASDYLQYATTSANATYHLLMAYRDFPDRFIDIKQANGLDGPNGVPDILDEAKWGLDWLLKMHPSPDRLFNQIGDDRDHMGMRIPKEDTFYGKGIERPVYFVSGEPQQRGKFMNATTGTASTAGKFASAFALAQQLFLKDSIFRKISPKQGYGIKAMSAYHFGLRAPGFTQTASVRSPYIYAEENWTDDMELAAAALSGLSARDPGMKSLQEGFLRQAYQYATTEKVTPWLGKDTASHYQWYPFINVGHAELVTLAKQLKSNRHHQEIIDSTLSFYKNGIEAVWKKANSNAFYRGVPFIWCSNNLTTSFATQCYWYRNLSGDDQYRQLEQANFDWLFGCNPWGTGMVYGLPANGDTPVDPHSAFTHLKNYPIDGGLVDGPVYTSIYKNLIGITLYQPDEYEAFQSNLAVYHDDYGDYSTNEPTMDGTASLVYLLAAKDAEGSKASSKTSSRQNRFSLNQGAIVRGDINKKTVALVFTGDEFGDGGIAIADALKKEQVKASFFLTGRFYRNPEFQNTVQRLKSDGHYLGPHSNNHLLYCDWKNRDSLLVTKREFDSDLQQNLEVMRQQGIDISRVKYFLPPYEWYNTSIASWSAEAGLQLINYTPGTISAADYTTPADGNYRSGEAIWESIRGFEQKQPAGMNGFILLLHIGTDPRRVDKFYNRLPELISYLKQKGYEFQPISEFLNID